MARERKYQLPKFLEDKGVEQKKYDTWLQNRAAAHAKRDKKRFSNPVFISNYKMLIHAEVQGSNGKDYYTGEDLHWEKILKYNNNLSQAGRRAYGKEFWLAPAVDHELEDGRWTFKICSRMTNACKNELCIDELIDFSIKLLKFKGYKVDISNHDNI